MRTKETVLRLAGQFRQDFWEKGEVVLQSPMLIQAAECARRFILGAVLSRSEILSGYAPFALGWIGASGSGPGGFAALLGSALGYLLGLGLVEGLRYVAAGILIYATAFALCDLRIYRMEWFMPLAAGGVTAVTGFIYLSEAGWDGTAAVCYATEVVLAGAACLCYRRLPDLLEEMEESPVAERLFLIATVLIAFCPIRLTWGLSPGIILACFFVLPVGEGNPGYRAAVGAGFGLAVDLTLGGGGLYTCALGAGGLLAEGARHRGRLVQIGLFLAAGMAAVIWFGGAVRDAGNLLVGALLYLALPRQAEAWLRRFFQREPAISTASMPAADGIRQSVSHQLGERAAAYRQLSQQLESQLKEEKQEYPGEIFDRTAERICKGCALQKICWQRDYRNTYQVLNRALQVMEEQGYCRERDFPDSFTSRCLRIRSFVTAANEELYAWRNRRRFQVQMRDSRQMVVRQFRQMSHLLEDTAVELGGELMPDARGIAAVKRVLRSNGVTATVSVQRNGQGRRVVELTGQELSAMAAADGRRRLAGALGIPLEGGELVRTEQGQRLRFRESPRLAAKVGAAARPKEGESVSGDNGTWFKDDRGTLWVVLCDGMGVGSAAAAESRLALRLLESFLRSGVAAETALHTLTGALAVRAQEGFGFSTIDLLRVDLFSGEGVVYKLGAAPSYLRKNGIINRLGQSALPAGLSMAGEERIDLTRFQAGPGDLIVLVTDGVTDGAEDLWLRERSENFPGSSPRELALALLEDPHARKDDDRTAVVILLSRRGEDERSGLMGTSA